MSKRKLEATRRNQERKAAGGRRTPPGYKPRKRKPISRRVLAALGGFGAVVLVAIIAVVLFTSNVFATDKLAGMNSLVKNGTCSERSYPSMGTAHTTNPKTVVKYTQSDPPTSGKAYSTAPPLMIYDQPVPQWILLQSLEHGNVLVQYGDKVPPADVLALRTTILSHRDHMLMAPYPKLGTRVVYTAWQRMLSCTGFQKDALIGAQAKWAGLKGIAPDRTAFAAPGSDVTSGTGW